MEKDASTNKIERALDELKRKLQKEREEAETLTAHFTHRREQRPPQEDSRLKKLGEELAAARKQLADQKQATEQVLQQLASEREERRNTKGEVGTDVQKLKAELNETRSQLQEQRSAAEGLIQQFAAERDESRARLSEVEPRMQSLDEELAAARQQLSEQQQIAETVQLLTAERDQVRAQIAEVESRIQMLQEESEAAQNQSREQRELALEIIRNLESERDEYRAQLNEQEAKTQKVEEELAAARQQAVAKGAPQNSDFGGREAASDASMNGRPDLWRTAVPLTLVLMSADLLSTNLRSAPETREAVREIQLGSQKLLDLLRAVNWNTPAQESRPADQHAPESESAAPDAEAPPAEAAPETPTGPFGSITPA